MGVEDLLLMFMYVLSFGGFLYIVIKFNAYYRERFKAGVINRFMLGALFFMASYSYKMIIAFLIRFSRSAETTAAARDALYSHHWTAAMVLTTVSILILANIVRTDSWNAWYDLKKYFPWFYRKGK